MLQALIYISLKHAKGPTEIPEVLAKTAISEMQQHALDERICRARKECSKQGVNVVLPPNSAVSCVTKHILPLTSLAPNWGKHRPLSGTNESPRWCPALSCSPFLLLWAELDPTLGWDVTYLEAVLWNAAHAGWCVPVLFAPDIFVWQRVCTAAAAWFCFS